MKGFKEDSQELGHVLRPHFHAGEGQDCSQLISVIAVVGELEMPDGRCRLTRFENGTPPKKVFFRSRVGLNRTGLRRALHQPIKMHEPISAASPLPCRTGGQQNANCDYADNPPHSVVMSPFDPPVNSRAGFRKKSAITLDNCRVNILD